MASLKNGRQGRAIIQYCHVLTSSEIIFIQMTDSMDILIKNYQYINKLVI